MILKQVNVVEEDLKLYLEDFVKMCYNRLEKGSTAYNKQFEQEDLYMEIMEELADVSNYAFLEYVKVRRLMEKKKRLVGKV